MIIWSEKRRFGKTTFAKNLVGDIKDYYILCGGESFTNDDFETKPQARLLIIDDMEIKLKQHLEMWKKLLSSQPTAIRDAYCNYRYDGCLPVIVTTNNYETFQELRTSTLFQTECYFLKAPNYMGPQGTYPSELTSEAQILSFDLDDQSELRENRGERSNNSCDEASQNSNSGKRWEEMKQNYDTFQKEIRSELYNGFRLMMECKVREQASINNYAVYNNSNHIVQNQTPNQTPPRSEINENEVQDSESFEEIQTTKKRFTSKNDTLPTATKTYDSKKNQDLS